MPIPEPIKGVIRAVEPIEKMESKLGEIYFGEAIASGNMVEDMFTTHLIDEVVFLRNIIKDKSNN